MICICQPSNRVFSKKHKKILDSVEKEKNATMYSTLSRSFPMLFFVSFFEAGCHICEDILVLYWFGQVLLFESAI